MGSGRGAIVPVLGRDARVARCSAKSGVIPALSRSCDAPRGDEPGRLTRADGIVLAMRSGPFGARAERIPHPPEGRMCHVEEVLFHRRRRRWWCSRSRRAPPVHGASTGVGDAVVDAAAAFPVTIETADGSVHDRRAAHAASCRCRRRATEMLFEVGAGEQVVAVDDQSDFPDGVPTTDLSGFEPNVEGIVSLRARPRRDRRRHRRRGQGLEQLDVPVLVQPAAVTIDDTYEQIAQLGAGDRSRRRGRRGGRARCATRSTRSSPRRPTAQGMTRLPRARRHLLQRHVRDVHRAGLRDVRRENIADEAKGAGTGYPQLSAEYIVEADPEPDRAGRQRVLRPDAGGRRRTAGMGRPDGGEDGGVVAIDDDVASRWGPRVVDFIARGRRRACRGRPRDVAHGGREPRTRRSRGDRGRRSASWSPRRSPGCSSGRCTSSRRGAPRSCSGGCRS